MAVDAEEPKETKTITVKYIEWGEYHYFASFCLSFGYRERPTTTADVKVTRIWADGTLIYALGDDDSQTFNPGLKFTVRQGTSNQMPVGGAELAYRDQLLIWFHDYDLGTSGSMPAFTAEFTDDNGPTLLDALEAFAIRAGFSEADIDIDPALDYPIVGYIADGQATLNTINTNLGFVYNFTGVEVAGTIKFKQSYDDNGDATVQWTVAETELAVISEAADNQQLDVIELAADQGLPRAVSIDYYDVDFNFDKNTQTAKRNLGTSGSESEVSVSIPIVATAEEMRAFASDALYRSWDRRNGHSLRLPRSFIGADPGDVIEWTIGNETYIAELQRVTINADWSVSVSAAEIAATFEPVTTIPYQPPATPVPTIVAEPINAVAFDIPDWQSDQTQPGLLNLRVAMGGYAPGTWTGGRFDMTRSDQPNGWAPRLQLGPSDEVGIARLDNAPTDFTGTGLDTTTVFSVKLRNMPVERLVPGELLAVGRDGRFELLTFATVTEIDEDTVELTNLTRGLFGTEDSINQHALNDHIAFVEDLHTITYTVDDYVNGRSFFYRGIAPLMPTTDADVLYFRPLGNSRRPYSPNNIVATRTYDGGDLIFTWEKQDRFDGEPDSVWSVEIYSEDWSLLLQRINNIVIADVEDPTIEWTYFVDYQFTNGINELTTINALVYQMNASHGVRGFPGGGGVEAISEGILTGSGVIELIAEASIGSDIFLDASGVIELIRTKAVITGGAEVVQLSGSGTISLSASADLLIGGLEGSGVIELLAPTANLSIVGEAPLLREMEYNYTDTDGGVTRTQIDVPAGTVEGDLLVFFAALIPIGGAPTAAWPLLNPTDIFGVDVPGDDGSGWEYLHQVKQGTGNRRDHFVLAWKIASDDEPDAYYWGSFNLSSYGFSNERRRGGLMRFQNYREDNPIVSSATQGTTSNTSLHTAPSTTGVLNGLLYNVVWPIVQSWDSYVGNDYLKPSDMTWYEYEAYASATFQTMPIAEKLLASAAATGSKTYTPPEVAATFGDPAETAYRAFSFVVNAWPFVSGSGVIELQATADLAPDSTQLLDAVGVIELQATADLEMATDPYELLATYTVTAGDASVDFPIDGYYADYDQIVIEIMGVIPTTNSRDLSIRFSADGGATFDNGASDYANGHMRFGSTVSATTTTFANGSAINMNSGNGAGNGASDGVSGRVTLYDFADAAKYTIAMYDLIVETDNHLTIRFAGSGVRRATEVTTDVRLLFSSGSTMADGVVKVIGVKK